MPVPPSYDDLLAARALLSGTPIWHTPVQTSRTLGELAGVDDLRLKLELFQKTGSFKPRGAYCSIAALTQADRDRGVIAVSAGNHAQAVAYAAALAGTRSVVVTWRSASRVKLDAAAAYGAEVAATRGHAPRGLRGDVPGARCARTRADPPLRRPRRARRVRAPSGSSCSRTCRTSAPS